VTLLFIQPNGKADLPFMNHDVATWVDTNISKHGGFGILAGSAISLWKPSSLPTAVALSNSIIRAVIEKNRLIDDLRADLETQILRDPGNDPLRLETVLEEIDLHYPGHVPAFVSVLADGAPNAIHFAIASWIMSARVKAFYTTNQDVLIERALEEKGCGRGSAYRVATPETDNDDSLFHVVKLHGSIDEPDSLRTTFTQVGRQLPLSVRAQFEKDLAQLPFLVVGYSGEDIDIRPSFLGSNLCDVLWVVHPHVATGSHFAHVLLEAGKNIRLCKCDLAELVTATPLENESSLGAKQAAAAASRVASNIPAGCLTLICSRIIRQSPESRNKKSLQDECLARAASTSEVNDDPNLRWRIPHYCGEERRFRSIFVFGNITALRFCLRAAREAQQDRNPMGRVIALCGAGEAIDMMGLGVVPMAFRLGFRYGFHPALAALQEATKTPDKRKLAQLDALTQYVAFYIARGHLANNDLKLAADQLQRLADTGVSAFIRGHNHRFLALIRAREGDFPRARNHIKSSLDHFGYLEMSIESADTLRNCASVELLAKNFPQAIKNVEKAIQNYRVEGIWRGMLRGYILLIVIILCRNLPCLLSWKRLSRAIAGL
jgi:hypothetical protein